MHLVQTLVSLMRRQSLQLTVASMTAAMGVSTAHAAPASPEGQQAIADKVAELGDYLTVYFPVRYQSEPQLTPDGRGAFQFFGRDRSAPATVAIYWSEDTGAHAVYSPTLEKWASRGYETGLGYPTTDTTGLGDGGSFTFFKKGKKEAAIYYEPNHTKGVPAVVEEPVLSAWRDSGFETGPHGWPCQDIESVPTSSSGSGRRCNSGDKVQLFDWDGKICLKQACVPKAGGEVYWNIR